MTPRTALVLTLLLTAAACGPAPEDGLGEPAFDVLAGGAFLPRDPWLEVADLYRTRHAAAAEKIDGQVPFAAAFEVVDGWGGPEEWGAWGLGERTQARFVVRDPRPYDLSLTAISPPGSANRPQTVRAVVNGREVGSFTAGPEWTTQRLPVPPEALRRGVNELELVYAYHLDGSLETDDRPLALGLERLGLVAAGRQPPAPGHPGFRVYRDQEVLVLETPGTYVAPLEVPRAPATFDFELRTPPDGGSELRVTALAVDGRESPLATFRSGDPKLRGATVHSLALDAYRGAPVLLLFEAEPAPGERFTIRRPRLVAKGAGAASSGGTPAGELPPIVLIILDAARADHFGVYGYGRDTTPVIDALAAESLVFRQVVAECSYTLCSMPSLLTGLSFVQHGLVNRELVLRDEVETLAEVLHGAGYLTLGYTGNPNNSRVTGTDQGFDEFTEIWKTHPKHITRQVVRRLGRGDLAARPFFLMIHYVPPHEPYAPDPEFDVFGDPAYHGPVTSDREFTRAVYARQIELDDADLAEMIALYDGNLRMADDAVGQVLASLKQAGFYDQALVIVTSDHGEAFLEHGRVGHNTTIYDEMLRVPLIVKLPRAWERPAEVDLGRLVTLADVPATILRRLGLPAPAALSGLDLFDAAAPERVVELRSAQPTDPLLGVRTPSFKAILADGGGELFDLAADPGEAVDAIGEHPVLHAGLALLLARAIRAPAPLRAGTRGSEISAEDQAMLRALGYL